MQCSPGHGVHLGMHPSYQGDVPWGARIWQGQVTAWSNPCRLPMQSRSRLAGPSLQLSRAGAVVGFLGPGGADLLHPVGGYKTACRAVALRGAEHRVPCWELI